jgi:nicotinamidase-related amidase
MAVRRLVQAGAVPITWMAVVSEWQRDWARVETARLLTEVVRDHGGASGIAYAWEVQLLESAAKAAKAAK